jgi:periplasmic copper chaperone A
MIDRRRLALVVIGLAIGASAEAHSYKLGHILIGHAWALPTQSSEGQIFFPLVNNGSGSDKLIGARSPIASMIELRANNRYDDPALTAIDLEPGKPVPMRPTARHLRLITLTKSLAQGDRFPLILDFLNAGEIEIEVFVEPGPSE